jgi:type VI secretion system protein ImpA
MSLADQLQKLSKPLSEENPCGENLEDSQLLASFDGYRLFGSSTPLNPETDWRDIRDKSFEALAQSHDVRLLTHYAAAAARLDGWNGFLGSIGVAAEWARNRWDTFYPRIDEDAIMRKNALSCFADRMAVLDGLRRVPIVEHVQLGRITLRDVEIAAGETQPTDADTNPATESQISAVFQGTELEELNTLAKALGTAIADIAAIESRMRDVGGSESSPDFEPLNVMLKRVNKLVGEQLAARGVGEAGAAEGGAEGGTGGGVTVAVGSIKSRADAMKAMDAIANFFKQNEPSSPVPLFLERAKRLVGKNFLEVLSDVVPDGVPAARAAGGIKDE